ncbi:FAD-dependent oxidoreductase [Neolewinella agarilytica]|uniref:FAD-dependent oxidoreductase n=1 Tax=Neolewinella agarilytica TaxID=478744 RepID=UPI0023568828|nr:FAD-dependent oxidoreductase [Neolewinella agarilytica]
MTSVLKLSNLPAGDSHQIDHGDYKVLLTNVEGTVYAVESKCSHFGLPLEKAALNGHRLRCPFHHACFDVRNGQQLEAPGLDGIATFGVEIIDGDIHISEEPITKPEAPATGDFAHKLDDGHYGYAIVGGGVAAANAVYGIREHDATGSIVLITREDLPPYDRTHVSKALLDGGKDLSDLPLHSEAFYRGQGVSLMEKTTAEEVDVANKTIALSGGKKISYDKILLATGGEPRKLDIPGSELDNIFTIRNARDGMAARNQVSEGTKVVIIGGSFIGLEAAMSLGKQGGDITVVAPEEVLFKGPFGEKVGKYVQQLHEEAGVSFRLGRKSSAFTGKGKVSSVTLDNGEELPADVVVVGIGVRPVTNYLRGLAGTADGGLKVDNHLACNVADTWAAGDIACYPDREGAARIEHWKVAAQQGRVAGRNMAGAAVPYTMLPFFWSNQQGVNFRYAGHATEYDNILFDGTPGEGPFLAFYLMGKHVQAVLGVKRDADVAAIAERMSHREMPNNDDLRGFNWR